MSRDQQVIVSWLYPGTVEGEFCDSLFDMLAHDLLGRQRIAARLSMRSGALLAAARNEVVKQFLDLDVCDWLLFIDSDMVFARDSLERLFASADPIEHPILGGLCYGLDPLTGPFPTLYKFMKTDGGVMTWRPNGLVDDEDPNHWPNRDTGLLQVDGTGAAFLMIHRSVLLAMRERGYSKAYPWFMESELPGGHPAGEDITFCVRARQLGFPITVDLDLRIGHKKHQIIAAAPVREPARATA